MDQRFARLERSIDRDAVEANKRRGEDLVAVDRVVRARRATDADDGNGGAAQADRDVDIRDVNAETLEETGKRRVACGRRAGAACIRSRVPAVGHGGGDRKNSEGCSDEELGEHCLK